MGHNIVPYAYGTIYAYGAEQNYRKNKELGADMLDITHYKHLLLLKNFHHDHFLTWHLLVYLALLSTDQ